MKKIPDKPIPKCSWCGERAVYKGEDGTFSCNQGKSLDVFNPHTSTCDGSAWINVSYTRMSEPL